jgi:transcriptional regulator with XRE-family HTH domain
MEIGAREEMSRFKKAIAADDVTTISLSELRKNQDFDSEFDDARELTALIRTLVTARKKLGIKQVDLAKKIGIGQSSLSEFEGGENDPYFSSVQRYARALGMKLQPVLTTRWAETVTVQDIAITANPDIWAKLQSKVMQTMYEGTPSKSQPLIGLPFKTRQEAK